LTKKTGGDIFILYLAKDVVAEVPAAFCGKHFPEICTMGRSTILLFTSHSSIHCLPFTFAFSATLKITETQTSFRARLKEWPVKTLYVNTDNKYWQ
jgi:hypothetical protein